MGVTVGVEVLLNVEVVVGVIVIVGVIVGVIEGVGVGYAEPYTFKPFNILKRKLMSKLIKP